MPDFTQNLNRYSYVLNNPLVYVDPDGENPLLLAAFVGFLFGAYTGAKIAIAKAQSGRLIYSLELNSRVSHTSRALNLSGVFNIGLHPYSLRFQMLLRNAGIRPRLFFHYITQH